MTTDSADRHRKRRREATRQGRHLPTLKELLGDFPFLSGSLQADAQAFAERLLPRIPERNADLRAALAALTIAPGITEFLAAHQAFLDQTANSRRSARRSPDPCVQATRCAYYAAVLGHREWAGMIAAECLAAAVSDEDGDAPALLRQALGWLMLSTERLPSSRGSFYLGPVADSKDAADRQGKWIVEKLEDMILLGAFAETPSPKTDTRRGSMVAPTTPAKADDKPSAPPAEPSPGIVVFTAIGSPETGEGKKVVKDFGPLLGKSLPLAARPDVAITRAALAADFPHAVAVIDSLLMELCTAEHVRLRPVILVGTPGCGKTTFAGALFSALGIRHATYSCGGVADASLSGAARHWSTGEPSLPVSLIKRWGTASPGIILDEIEKAGTSKHNGNLLDALLAMLEPQSARGWHDPYIDGAVDLSAVLWLATANVLADIPAPLRDRCRVVMFPEPRSEHLEPLAQAVQIQSLARQGLDQRWARPLDGEELDVLRGFWKGGSLRRLTRLVEGIVAARGREAGVH